MEFRNKTHTDRWVSADSYNENWKKRAVELMDLFLKHEYVEDSSYTVSEFGCGAYAPFHTLFDGKDGFEVQKFDIKEWDEDTEFLDFNSPDVSIPTANISVFSGVLEYLNDVPSTLKNVMAKSDYVLMSYAFVPSALLSDDGEFLSKINNRAASNGWRNHYSNRDIVEMISNVGVLTAVGSWKKNQSLFLIRNFDVDNAKSS